MVPVASSLPESSQGVELACYFFLPRGAQTWRADQHSGHQGPASSSGRGAGLPRSESSRRPPACKRAVSCCASSGITQWLLCGEEVGDLQGIASWALPSHRHAICIHLHKLCICVHSSLTPQPNEIMGRHRNAMYGRQTLAGASPVSDGPNASAQWTDIHTALRGSQDEWGTGLPPGSGHLPAVPEASGSGAAASPGNAKPWARARAHT